VFLSDVVSVSPLYLYSPYFFNITTFKRDVKFETYPSIIDPHSFELFYKRVKDALADNEMRRRNIVALILGLNLG
jgi:hypothetical protein